MDKFRHLCSLLLCSSVQLVVCWALMTLWVSFLAEEKNPLTNQKQRNKINKLASVIMFGRWLESRLWVWFPGQQQWGHQEDLRDKRSKNETFCWNLSCRHALWTSFIFHTASGFSCCAPRHVCLIRRRQTARRPSSTPILEKQTVDLNFLLYLFWKGKNKLLLLFLLLMYLFIYLL